MEMDIYMRRRLVALGVLVGIFILFVLLIKSCGDDEEGPAPLQTQTGATGETGPTALPLDEYIVQADAICARANSAVGSLDPEDPDALRQELRITSRELNELRALEPERTPRTLKQFLSALADVVDALEAKHTATEAGDTVAADEAQVAIDTAEVEARELGDRFGFADCGQFLDAGQGPAAGAPDVGGTAGDLGATAPPSGGVAPPTDTTTPPADTTTPPADTTTPPADSGTGGITP